MLNEIECLKKVVESALKENVKSRDSDKHLILDVLNRMGFDIYINNEDLDKMPSFESITRARRLIQSENSDLKASDKVQEFRQEREINFRHISNNNIRDNNRVEIIVSPNNRQLFL